MKHIFSKVAKIGEQVRAAQAIKVELSLIGDVQSKVQEMRKLDNDVNSFLSEFQRLVNDLNAKVAEGQKYQQRADALTSEGVKLVSNASNALKELGLEAKDSPQVLELFNLNRTLTERVFSIGEQFSKIKKP
jgi:predicted patatin/cPLA2 family phospholipase